MKREKIKIITIILINIFIFYIFSELILLAFDLPKEYKTHTYPPQFQRIKDKDILYVNKPSTSIDFTYDGNPRGYFRADNTVNHKTNSYGFRGAEFSFKKGKNTIRITFLGDSFTFGEGVYFKDTYPQQLKNLILQKNLFKNKDIEVINLGVGGYNTEQEIALLKNFADKLQNDLIVIGYTINDAEPYLFLPVQNGMIRRQRENEVFGNLSTKIDGSFFITFSRLNRLLLQIYQSRQTTRKTLSYYQSIYSEKSKSWLRTKKALEELDNYSQSKKTPIIILMFPMFYKLNNNYPLKNIHELVKKTIEKTSLIYLDIYPRLINYKDSDLWVHPTDQHPNEIVHKIAAEMLLQYLINYPNLISKSDD